MLAVTVQKVNTYIPIEWVSKNLDMAFITHFSILSWSLCPALAAIFKKIMLYKMWATKLDASAAMYTRSVVGIWSLAVSGIDEDVWSMTLCGICDVPLCLWCCTFWLNLLWENYDFVDIFIQKTVQLCPFNILKRSVYGHKKTCMKIRKHMHMNEPFFCE